MTGQCLISRFPLGWGRWLFQLLFGPPRGKSRPNLKARLETNSLQICKWARVATSGWRAQTWCRLNNHTAQGSAKLQGLPRLPSVQPRECTLQRVALPCARTHTNAHPKLLGVSRAVEETNPGRPSVGKAPHPPRTGSNSVTSQRLQRSRPVAERGRGRSGRPSRVPWTHPPKLQSLPSAPSPSSAAAA